jgi:short-subunit dehydrogenase
MSIVIVGGSAGLGRDLANKFAQAGHDLILLARDSRDLSAVALDLMIKHQIQVTTLAVDLGSDDSYLDRLTGIVSENLPIDGLLFPIGAVLPTDKVDITAGETAWLLKVNFTEIVNIINRLLPLMDSTSKLVIIGFGSIAAIRGRGNNLIYAAAKRALQSYFESLRHALSDSSILVQYYVLGYLDTTQTTGLRTMFPIGRTDHLSERVLNGFGKDVGVVYYPKYWRLISLLLRLSPWNVYKRIRF